MVTIHIKDDFIKLGQALKLAGLVDSGVDAKFVIQDGLEHPQPLPARPRPWRVPRLGLLLWPHAAPHRVCRSQDYQLNYSFFWFIGINLTCPFSPEGNGSQWP